MYVEWLWLGRKGWGGGNGSKEIDRQSKGDRLGGGAKVIFILSLHHQDLLELAETLGPARPQRLPQEGTLCTTIVCITGA